MGEQRSGQLRERQGLEPHVAGPGQSGEEDLVTAEDRVLDALDPVELEGDGGVEHADVSGADPQALARGELVVEDLTVELDPGVPAAPTRWRMNPAPPKSPAPSFCWSPIDSSTLGIPHR